MKRILLKLSGESLATNIATLNNYADLSYLEEENAFKYINGFGIADKHMLVKIASDIKKAQESCVEIAIVIGGGNVCRGGSLDAISGKKQRTITDKIGMLATIINGFVLSAALEAMGIKSVVLSTRSMPSISELYTISNANKYITNGFIVICVGGSGQPFFSTDTAAVIRACELDCDMLFKATKVDGIYDCDPKINSNAEFIRSINYDDFLRKNIKIMDSTAISIAKNERLPIEVFCIYEKNSISRALTGEIQKSTIVDPQVVQK